MNIKTLMALGMLTFSLACASGASSGDGTTPQQSANTAQQSAQTPAGTTPVKVGDVSPDFTLEDQNGQQVKLSEARGETPVVLVFYRGYW